MDVLTDVLRALHLRGTVYFHARFCAPWGMEITPPRVANFHIVVSGKAWLRCEAKPEGVSLDPGSVVVFPHGARHSLADSADGAVQPAEQFLASGRASEDGRKIFGGEGTTTSMICGHFAHDESPSHPLLSTLPELIHLRAGDLADPQWMRTATELAAAESQSAQQGSTAVVDRLAEVLLIQLLRAYTASETPAPGFLAALGDPMLAKVLGGIHAEPAYPWSLLELASRGGVSKTVLSERFNARVGLSPMRYVQLWRMQRARDLLVETQRTLADIAEAVGYESEWAFAKAFKRVFGVGPGAARRDALQSA